MRCRNAILPFNISISHFTFTLHTDYLRLLPESSWFSACMATLSDPWPPMKPRAAATRIPKARIWTRVQRSRNRWPMHRRRLQSWEHNSAANPLHHARTISCPIRDHHLIKQQVSFFTFCFWNHCRGMLVIPHFPISTSRCSTSTVQIEILKI